MEKVKLTREQAEAIERIKTDINEGFTKGNIRTQLEKRWLSSPYASLNELTMEQYIASLLGDYEVEESFEVGDGVTEKREGGKTYRVTEVYKDWGTGAEYVRNENTGELQLFRHIRHATPEEIAKEKERRWWAKHGRDVWELRENDLLYYDDEFEEVEEVSEFGAIMLSSERVYFPIKTISGKFSVVCFAEDRKDVKP